MINSVFFVLRTCCQVPKSYGKSYLRQLIGCGLWNLDRGLSPTSGTSVFRGDNKRVIGLAE